jgi:hypothetical protein
MVLERLSEGRSSFLVVKRKSLNSSHASDSTERVMDPCDIQHVRNLLDPLADIRDAHPLGPLQYKFSRWELSRPQLVLQPYDLNVV